VYGLSEGVKALTFLKIMNKKVWINRGDFCTFGTLSQIWDNGYIKMACIKFPFKIKVSTHSSEMFELDYLWCLEEELNFI
jgi:hypothetical protein